MKVLKTIVGPRNLSRNKRSLRIVEHEGSENDRRIDVVAEAVRMCNHFVNDSSITARDGKIAMEEYRLCDTFELRELLRETPGWARRPPHGLQYGDNFLDKYRADIKDLFLIGKGDNEKKMNPTTMLEQLTKKHPRRYTLPGETVIRQEISTLFAYQKSENSQGNNRVKGRKAKLPQVYVEKINEYLDRATDLRSLKPAAAYKRLVEDFKGDDGKLPDNFPGAAILKRKFSALKASYKISETSKNM